MVDDFSLWLAMRDPRKVEAERFGAVDIAAQMFGSAKHRRMVREHEARKEVMRLLLTGRPKERPHILVRRVPVLTKEQLDVARRIAFDIRQKRINQEEIEEIR